MELDEKIEFAQAFYSDKLEETVDQLYLDLDRDNHFERNTYKSDLVERALEYGDRTLKREDSGRSTAKGYGRQVEEGKYRQKLHQEFDGLVDEEEIDEVIDTVFNPPKSSPIDNR